MRPICVKCQRFYRCKKNGFPFVEMANGVTAPDKSEPYKLWMGDMYECSDCGSQIVVGAGQRPLAEHFEPDFAKRVEAYRIHDAPDGVMIQVTD